MKRFLFKLAFLYPRMYAFFSYYRKKERKRECEEKVKLFYNTDMDPKGVKRIVRGIFEVRRLRKVQRYLIPHIDHRFIQQFVTIEGLDILDRAVATKRGIILISGHIGTVHVGFNILRALEYEINLLKEGNPANQRSTKFLHFDPNEFTIFTHDAPCRIVQKKESLKSSDQEGLSSIQPIQGEEGKKWKFLSLGEQ